MKKEDLYNGITGIDPQYLEGAEKYRKGRPVRSRIWIAAVACVCLLLACSIRFFPKKTQLPFVLTAYAVEADGENETPAPVDGFAGVLANEMTLNEDIPVSVFSRSMQTYAFVFSYPSADLNEKPHITTIFAPTEHVDDDLNCISITYAGDFAYEKNGNVYIYYIFREKSELYEFTYQTIPDKENKRYEIAVSVYKKGDDYFARLNSIRQVEKLDEEEYRQKSVERLRKNYPEYFTISKDKGVEIYVWQMAEDAYCCGLLEKTDRQKTNEEIWALQFKALSVDETKWILAEIGAKTENITVIPMSEPYSSYAYVIDDEYRERVAKLFE